LGDPGVERRINEDGSSGRSVWGYGLDRAGSRYGHLVGSFESGNELSGSLKCGEFLD